MSYENYTFIIFCLSRLSKAHGVRPHVKKEKRATISVFALVTQLASASFALCYVFSECSEIIMTFWKTISCVRSQQEIAIAIAARKY